MGKLCVHLVNVESLSRAKNNKNIIYIDSAKLESACNKSTQSGPLAAKQYIQRRVMHCKAFVACWMILCVYIAENAKCDPCDWSQKRPHSVGLKGMSQFVLFS